VPTPPPLPTTSSHDLCGLPAGSYRFLTHRHRRHPRPPSVRRVVDGGTYVRGPGSGPTLYSLHRATLDRRPTHPGGSLLNPKFFRNGIVMLVLVVGTAALLFTWITASSTPVTTGYSKFLGDVAAGQVKEVVQQGTTLTVKKTGATTETYTVTVPTILTDVYGDMRAAADKTGKVLEPDIFKATPAPDTSWLGLFLTAVLPLLIIGGFIFFMMRQAQGTNNQALSFGKSRARMFLGNKTVVTFNDVAGVDEAKTELQEVVEFLKYPEKFNSLGARIPRGVLLVGP